MRGQWMPIGANPVIMIFAAWQLCGVSEWVSLDWRVGFGLVSNWQWIGRLVRDWAGIGRLMDCRISTGWGDWPMIDWSVIGIWLVNWWWTGGLFQDWHWIGRLIKDWHIGPGLDCMNRPLLRHFGWSRIVLVPLTNWRIKTGLALDWRIGKRLTN